MEPKTGKVSDLLVLVRASASIRSFNCYPQTFPLGTFTVLRQKSPFRRPLSLPSPSSSDPLRLTLPYPSPLRFRLRISQACPSSAVPRLLKMLRFPPLRFYTHWFTTRSAHTLKHTLEVRRLVTESNREQIRKRKLAYQVPKRE